MGLEKVAYDMGKTMEGNRQEIEMADRLERLETRRMDHTLKKTKDSYYQRKAKREFRSQGFGIDNNRMWDDK